jgi:hypothetical protein
MERPMIRLACTIVCILGLLTSAHANLVEKKVQSGSSRIGEVFLKTLAREASKDEYRVTEKTEVLLNGQPCPYKEIPDNAIIVYLEIDSSINKEIVKIHFRSRTGPVKKLPARATIKRGHR